MLYSSQTRYALPLHEPPRVKYLAVGVQRPSDNDKHWAVPGHWYAHIYSYDSEICINGEWFEIRPGYAGLIPPDAKVSCRYRGRCTHLYAHFAFDKRKPRSAPPMHVPAMQDLGPRYLPLSDRFYDAINVFPANPARATARLWELLWEFAEPTGVDGARPGAPATAPVHPCVQRICQVVDQYLTLPLSVPYLANYVDLSPNYLTSLFRKHMNTTVVAYVRRRRALRAKHLLQHSSLPIKTVAQQVGIPDPHMFNKIIRRELGGSPSAVRAGVTAR